MNLAPQQLSNWIRAAKDGQFAQPADAMPAFVPVVSVEPAQVNRAAQERRSAVIEIVIGAIKVRAPGGTRRTRRLSGAVCGSALQRMSGGVPLDLNATHPLPTQRMPAIADDDAHIGQDGQVFAFVNCSLLTLTRCMTRSGLITCPAMPE
jgi:hypothetical protein